MCKIKDSIIDVPVDDTDYDYDYDKDDADYHEFKDNNKYDDGQSRNYDI